MARRLYSSSSSAFESAQALYSSSHLHTIILLTWTDYKTIFLPVTSFATATAPAYSMSRLLQVCIWTWLHLILCNVSNQSSSIGEDAINRPWRPLPSGRITVSQAFQLRWSMVAVCTLWSAAYGSDLILVTLCLVLVTMLYDEAGLSNHPLGKNICNVGGYSAFETGASKIMVNNDLDRVSKLAIILSSMVIFTTIQAQDFSDVDGDMASQRITFPIYAPEFSRLFTLVALPVWSVVLCWFWSVGWLAGVLYVCLGSYVGTRYYCVRSQEADKRSYIFFNVWLVVSHVFPYNARAGVFSF